MITDCAFANMVPKRQSATISYSKTLKGKEFSHWTRVSSAAIEPQLQPYSPGPASIIPCNIKPKKKLKFMLPLIAIPIWCFASSNVVTFQAYIDTDTVINTVIA